MRSLLLSFFLATVLAVCFASPGIDAQHGVVSDILARHGSSPDPVSLPPKEEHVEEPPLSSPKRHSSRPRMNRQGGNRWQRDESAIFEHRPSISKVQLNRQKAVDLDSPRQKSWKESGLSRQHGQRWRRDAEAFVENDALLNRAVDQNDRKNTGSPGSDRNANGDKFDSIELPPPPKAVNIKQQFATRYQEPLDGPQTPSSYNTPKSATSPWHMVSKNGKDSHSGSPSPPGSPTKEGSSPKGHKTPVNKESKKGASKNQKHHSPKSDNEKSPISSPRFEDAQPGKDSNPRRDLNLEHIVARDASFFGHGQSDEQSGHHEPDLARKLTRQYAGRFYPARRAIPDNPATQSHGQLGPRHGVNSPQEKLQESSKQCPGSRAAAPRTADTGDLHHISRSADPDQASHVSEPAHQPALSNKDESSSKKEQDAHAKEKATAKKGKAKHKKGRKHNKKKGKHTSTSKAKGVAKKKKGAAKKNKTGQKNGALEGKDKDKKKLLKSKVAAKDKSKTKADDAKKEKKKEKDAAGNKPTTKEKTAAKKMEDKEKQDERKEDEEEKKKDADEDKREKKLEKENDDMEKDSK